MNLRVHLGTAVARSAPIRVPVRSHVVFESDANVAMRAQAAIQVKTGDGPFEQRV